MFDFLTEEECVKIWEEWLKWHHVECSSFDQLWFGYDDLSDLSGIDVKRLKKFMKVLRDNNIAYSTTLWSEEGTLRGKGNFIIERYVEKSWEEIKEILEKNL